MKLSRSLVGLVLTSNFYLLCACSEEANFNRFYVGNNEKETIASSLHNAELAYNKGDYTQAEKWVQKAYNFNPMSEKVAVLKAYILLAQAGVGTFELARSLIELNEEEKTNTAPVSENKTSETLDRLGAIISDIAPMYTEVDSAQCSAECKRILTEHAIKLPKTAPLARSDSPVLVFINKAIAGICPFVNPNAKTGDRGPDTNITTITDERHDADHCEPTTGVRNLKAKSHFLWAFAHLGEAIAFNLILAPQIAALQNAATSLRTNDNLQDIALYVRDIKAFAEILDIIMPTGADEKDSMLTAMFNDLEAVGNGFGEMEGIPVEVKKSITDVIANLKTKKEELENKLKESGGGDIVSGASVLKDQLTEKLAKEIKAQVEAVDSVAVERKKALDADPEKKQEFCDAYKTISQIDFEYCNA